MTPPSPQEVHHLAIETVIRLMRASELVATLPVTDTDFPFINCSFEPTEAFETLRPLFEARREALRRRDYQAADAAQSELARAGLSLQSADGGVVVRHFLLNVAGDRASVRSWPEGLTFTSFHSQQGTGG